MATLLWPDLLDKHRWVVELMEEQLKRTTQRPEALAARAGVRLAGAGEGLPWPFGALAGKYPLFEIEEIKAARHEALLGKAE